MRGERRQGTKRGRRREPWLGWEGEDNHVAFARSQRLSE